MFLLRDILGAHFSSWAGRSHVLDDITLPGWLERRWGWSAKRERRRYEQVERTYEREPVGKDATRDR